MRKVRKKIAIIIYGYGLGNSPSLINMAQLLSRAGYDVDFFTCNTYLGNASFAEPNIQIHDCGETLDRESSRSRAGWALRAASAKIEQSLPLSLKTKLEERRLRKAVAAFAESIDSPVAQDAYACIIGVEPCSLMAASILAQRYAIPHVYHNMELHTKGEAQDAHEGALKAIEREFHGGAAFTITQDETRARIMAAENGVAPNRMVIMPVGADGDPFTAKTSFLRQRFGLGADSVIVLYAGFFAEWAMCEEMASSAQSWPDRFVLVLHSHGYNDPAYTERLRKYEGDRVRLSESPVAYEDLAAFLASADMGVALYRDKGKNFRLIGSASGKIAHYLKSGLPVIVNTYPGIAEIVDAYHCGIAIDSMSELASAVQTIDDQREEMREGAFRCYDERYRLSRHFRKVLDRLEQL